MSSAPISSRVRAQSIDSAIEGGFFRSRAPDHVDDLDQPPRQPLVEIRRVQADDLELPVHRRIVEPEIEAAALQRLGELAGVVGGEDHDRLGARLDHAELRDRDLEVGEDLEQHRLELLVGLVDLVDQQDDRVLGADRLEQRPGEEEVLAEDVAARPSPRALGCRLGLAGGLGLDPQQLLAVVPLVERLCLVEPLVALKANQPAVGRTRERLGELGLADACGALDQHRLAEPLREEGDERGRLVGQVSDLAESLANLGD